jgi:hypothetical protein
MWVIGDGGLGYLWITVLRYLPTPRFFAKESGNY